MRYSGHSAGLIIRRIVTIG